MRLLLFVVLSSVVVPAHAAKDPTTVRIEWKLALDADGKIDSLKPVNPEYLPDVRKQIEPIVRTWHFTPGKVDGRPAATETTLGVTIAFDAYSTNAIRYHARIRGASTGGTYKHTTTPHYPESSQRTKEEGEVVLRVNYDADGAVTSVRNVPEMSADHVSSALTAAATDAVKHWTFRPETVAGRGVASAALVPFCFKLADAPCHWKPSPGERALQSGSAIALSSVVGIDTGDEAHLP
jgi:TonB family protein